MKRKFAFLTLLLFLSACNLFRPDEQIRSLADVAKIVVPDTVNYFEAFEVRAEVIMDHTCKYVGPIMEATSDGCTIRIIVEVVGVSYHQVNINEWHTFKLRPLKTGHYIIRVQSKHTDDLVVSTYVR